MKTNTLLKVCDPAPNSGVLVLPIITPPIFSILSTIKSEEFGILSLNIFEKFFLSLFVVSFFVLGYLGSVPPNPVRTLFAQIFTFTYFAYFFLMPIYSKYEKCKPVPERVTLS